MKIVYMGTPDFSVGPLKALIEAGHTVTAVVTQPDKAKGRSGKLVSTPVKECAMEYGIPVLTPVKIKTAEAVAQLKEYEADVYVVAAFGQILSQEILDIPRYGCLNIHASLLPKYRGSAPIQWAILDGEEKTGVTIMQMDAGIDTGDMLLKREMVIADDETGGSLFDKLAVMGSELIVEALEKLEKGELTPKKQDDSLSCYAKMLTKAQGQINWNDEAVKIERLIRGLNPWPSAYTMLNGKTLKIWEAKVTEAESDGLPGTVSCVTKDSVCVNCGSGQLALISVQLEGKKRMQVKDFLLGNKIEKGDVIG
ncbi:MAG: methionyl-tRNA formyltransferase [Lachnospiraceae bacterium]|nr:methionyl-tRNA formyltransferase [Lachnospiraceae bacterium]